MRFHSYDTDREFRWYDTIGLAILAVAVLAAVAFIVYGAVVGPVFVAGHLLAGEWWLAFEDAGTAAAAWLIIVLNWALLGM